MNETEPFDVVDGVSVYRDHAVKHQFWYLPTKPALARRDGRAVFTLISYRDRPSGTATTMDAGGYLNFQVDLRLPDETRDKIIAAARRTLAEENQTETVEPRLNPVPFHGGSVQVCVWNAKSPAPPTSNANPTTPAAATNQHVVSMIGSTRPSLVGDNTAIFSVKLNAQGAELIDRAMQANSGEAAVIGILYDLDYTAMLPELRVRVRANLERAYQQISADLKGQYAFFETDIAAIVERLKEQQLLTIETIDPIGSPESQKAVDAFTDHFKRYITDKWFEAKLAPNRTFAVAADLDKVGKRGDEMLGRATAARNQQTALGKQRIALEAELAAQREVDGRKQTVAELAGEIARLGREIKGLAPEDVVVGKAKQGCLDAARALHGVLIKLDAVDAAIAGLQGKIQTAPKPDPALDKQLAEKKLERTDLEGQRSLAAAARAEATLDLAQALAEVERQEAAKQREADDAQDEGDRLKTQAAAGPAAPGADPPSKAPDAVAPKSELMDLLGTHSDQLASIAAGLPIVALSFKEVHQHEERAFNGEFSSRKAIARSYHPNGFVSLSPADLGGLADHGYFLKLTLGDDFWRTTQFDITGPAELAAYGLKSAAVTLRYGDGDGEPERYDVSFPTPAATAQTKQERKTWVTPKLRDGALEYRVHYAFSPREWDAYGDNPVQIAATDVRTIDIEPEEHFTFHAIDVEPESAGIVGTRVQEVIVTLHYPSALQQLASGAPPRRTKVMQFRPGAVAKQTWKLRVPGRRSPLTYSYQVSYRLARGGSIERPVSEDHQPRLVVAGLAATKDRKVKLLQTALPWTGVELAMLDVRYVDPANAIDVEATIDLGLAGTGTATTATKEWTVAIADETVKAFSWRLYVMMKDGSERELAGTHADLTRPLVLRLPPPADAPEST
jgi:hypothetical protein